MVQPLLPWSATAPNLPEHGDNPIHTDAGARAAGYPRAVVAGTTVYAHMTHPPAAAWGLDWLGRGGAEVRFLDAVLADDQVDYTVAAADGAWVVEARTGGAVRASCRVWTEATVAPPSSGEPLEPMTFTLDPPWAAYGIRAGDDLGLYHEHDVVHPAAWPSLANRVMRTQLVRGPWIHTRSHIAHVGLARPASTAVVESTVIDRYTTRMGRRAVVDVRISVDGRPVCALEHEAIVELVG